MIGKLFTEHPASVNESYFEHLCSALTFSALMFIGTLACLIHAFLPFLCVTTGSRKITELHDRMVVNRVRQPSSNSSENSTSAASQSL